MTDTDGVTRHLRFSLFTADSPRVISKMYSSNYESEFRTRTERI